MKNLVFAVFLLFSLNISLAQEIKIDTKKALQWTFNEKMKLKPHHAAKLAEKESPEVREKILKSVKSLGEADLTNSEKLEAEIHAAINPADSNNIVVSPIRQDGAAGSIFCPIYYTKDFGDTWAVSSFQNMPYVSGQMSGGGGDPVFAYDADGKLYFTWIDLYGDLMSFMFGTVNMGIFWAYSEDGGETWIKPVHDTVLLGSMNMTFMSPTSINEPISDKQWMACDRSGGTYNNNLYISYVTIGDDGSGGATYQIKVKTKPAGVDQFTTEAEVSYPASFPFVQFASLAVDNSGNVHVVFYGVNSMGTNLGVWHSVSTDGGASFSAPNLISNIYMNLPILGLEPRHEIPGIDTSRLYPSPYMACDPNNGNVYVTWTAFGINSDAGHGSDVYFSRSTNNGATWEAPIRVNNDPFGTGIHNYYSSIFVKDNGEIKVSWYDRRDDPANINTHYYFATSTNEGVSFGTNYPATTVPTDFSTIGSQNSNFGIGEYTQILASETYTIPVWCDGRNNDGNVNVYVSFINDLTVGIHDLNPVTDMVSFGNIFPNPSSDNASINIALKDKTDIELILIDATGKQVLYEKPGSFPAGNHNIDFKLNKLAPGNYYLNVKTIFGNAIRPLIVE